MMKDEFKTRFPENPQNEERGTTRTGIEIKMSKNCLFPRPLKNTIDPLWKKGVTIEGLLLINVHLL